jgi:hypothetical protein
MGKYVATATAREAEGEVQFVVETENGAKAAWSEARRLCREGATVQPPEEESASVALEPRTHGVRAVYRLDKPRRRAAPTEPTALDLVAACEANGVTVAKKVRDQLDQLRRDRGLVADDTRGDDDAAQESEADAA